MTETCNSTMNCAEKIKLLYSYGGKIIPRPSDGLLRYVGGYTRVLSVNRSIAFSELMVKFGEACGSSMDLTCKLPSEDLDLLVSIKSEDDLKNVMDEYDRVSSDMKIRAVLFPMKLVKKVSAPSSPMSCFDFPSAPKLPKKTVPASTFRYVDPPQAAAYPCYAPAIGYPVANLKHRDFDRMNSRHLHHVPHRNHPHPHYYLLAGRMKVNNSVH